MSDTNSGRNGLDMLLVFLAGAATGAAIALLTTPRTGPEAREKIQEFAKVASEKAGKLPGAVREAYNRGTEAAKDSFTQAIKGS